MAQFGACDALPLQGLNLKYLSGDWGPNERGLHPPMALLSWLIRHPCEWAPEPVQDKRADLKKGDAQTVALALASLRAGCPDRAWFILEGKTYPDVLLETPDALIVIEGKRTEAGPTTHTTWMPRRHQIWRHIDAAWEIRGQRQVFGLFIVEAQDGRVPVDWAYAACTTLADDAIRGSFPHRSADEVAALRRCFRGVTTWSHVCHEFGIDERQLPDTVEEPTA
jgi:hypothetical protein